MPTCSNSDCGKKQARLHKNGLYTGCNYNNVKKSNNSNDFEDVYTYKLDDSINSNEINLMDSDRNIINILKKCMKNEMDSQQEVIDSQ